MRVKLMDTASTIGAGKTGLNSSSAGLIISTIKINEPTPVVYTQAGTTIESLTTLGMFETPTASKCRFREVDATNHPGVYEIHLANARFSSSIGTIISFSGTAGMAQGDFEIQSENISVNVIQVGGTTQTAADIGALITATLGSDSLPKISADAMVRTGLQVMAASVTSSALSSISTQITSDHGPGSYTTVTLAAVQSLYNVSTFSTSATVDGKTYDYIYELMMAMVNGKFAYNTGNNNLAFFKNDNVTTLTIVNIPDDNNRTRVS